MARQQKKKRGGGGGGGKGAPGHAGLGGGQQMEGGMAVDEKSEEQIAVRQVTKAFYDECEAMAKRVKSNPTEDVTERRVHMVKSILRVNITALTGTMKDSNVKDPATTKKRKKAIKRLTKSTDEFEQKEHTEVGLFEVARAALKSLEVAYEAFGPAWKFMKENVVEMAMYRLGKLKDEDLLDSPKTEMEKLVKKAKDLIVEVEKKVEEKEAKLKEMKRKYMKDASTNTDDDFGDDSVSPHGSLASCSYHDRSTDHVNSPSGSSVNNRTRSVSSSTSSMYEWPDAYVVRRVKRNDEWSQFCRVYNGK